MEHYFHQKLYGQNCHIWIVSLRLSCFYFSMNAIIVIVLIIIIDLNSFMKNHFSFQEEQEERRIALLAASPPLITFTDIPEQNSLFLPFSFGYYFCTFIPPQPSAPTTTHTMQHLLPHNPVRSGKSAPITESDGNLGGSPSPHIATAEIVPWASSADLWKKKKTYFASLLNHIWKKKTSVHAQLILKWKHI